MLDDDESEVTVLINGTLSEIPLDGPIDTELELKAIGLNEVSEKVSLKDGILRSKELVLEATMFNEGDSIPNVVLIAALEGLAVEAVVETSELGATGVVVLVIAESNAEISDESPIAELDSNKIGLVDRKVVGGAARVVDKELKLTDKVFDGMTLGNVNDVRPAISEVVLAELVLKLTTEVRIGIPLDG